MLYKHNVIAMGKVTYTIPLLDIHLVTSRQWNHYNDPSRVHGKNQLQKFVERETLARLLASIVEIHFLLTQRLPLHTSMCVYGKFNQYTTTLRPRQTGNDVIHTETLANTIGSSTR